jgi:hypothetical protein
MEAARLGSWSYDIGSGRTTWDARLEEMHGLGVGDFGGTFEDWVAALHPDDRAECIARVENALANPGPYVLLHKTIWPDGSLHSVECRGTVLVDDDGQPTGTTGIAMDVTLREAHAAAVDEALANERQIVRALQHALLPGALPQVAGATVTARYRAADVGAGIGGDWYVVVATPDGRLGLAIGDVAGHGLEAVAEMASARFSLRALALTEPRPDVVLHRLNETVKTFDRTMITALYGVLDPRDRTWTFASAGHVPAVVSEKSGATRVLQYPSSPPLGYAETFVTHTVTLSAGSNLLLYTDGLIERRGEPLDRGITRLEAACTKAPSGAKDFADWVVASMLRGESHEDDVALLSICLD